MFHQLTELLNVTSSHPVLAVPMQTPTVADIAKMANQFHFDTLVHFFPP